MDNFRPPTAAHFVLSTYSKASHNADFGDKKNQCISKTVYCGLLYRDIKKPCICEISAYSLYYKISVDRIFWTN